MNEVIEKSIVYLKENFKSNITLTDIANHVGMSKFHFHRLFKKETGQTPLQYLIEIKMDFAAHYLVMYPKRKQIDLAFESGFLSPSIFARTFKNFFGVSSLQYRKSKNIIVDSNDAKTGAINITYLPKKELNVLVTSLQKDAMQAAYQKLIETTSNKHAIGIFMDAPFHKAHDQCVYFLGDDGSNEILKTKHKYVIEEGYYTTILVEGDIHSVEKEIIDFKQNVIDPSPYEIASFIGHEKVQISREIDFDYTHAKRLIHLKIKRK